MNVALREALGTELATEDEGDKVTIDAKIMP